MSLTINHNLMAAQTARNLVLHYGELATSVRRMSSGLRISQSADDAAGLAARELMRAEVASLNQGIRNVNDAVSLVQVADGSLGVIDEKLIRMKELAEQAATGTYNSDQRLIIDSEFQAMRSEITRIATATRFNRLRLLDSDADLLIHFGPDNETGVDNYPIPLRDATAAGLGLATTAPSTVPSLDSLIANGGAMQNFTSGIVSFARIPQGTTNLYLHLDDLGLNDTIQIFTAGGRHLAGTPLGNQVWTDIAIANAGDMNAQVLTDANGFRTGAAYDGAQLNGTGAALAFDDVAPYNVFNVDGMQIGYSGSNNPFDNEEYLTIDRASEDLVLLVVGTGQFDIQGSWASMPQPPAGGAIDVRTQDNAQRTLGLINSAIIKKDSIRAAFGALQNRLENTVTNLSIQAENLQASESRISDADMAEEMTQFVASQIKAQVATATLAQTNTLPRMALKLIEEGGAG